MKAKPFIISIALLYTTHFMSCIEDIEGPNCEVSAKIDGVDFCGTSATYTWPDDSVINITGSNDDFESISITFKGLSTGSYDIESNNATYTDASLKSFFSTTGNVFITAYSENKISGTFSFEAETHDNSNSVTITEGKFENIERSSIN